MWIVAPALSFSLLWAAFIATGKAGIRESFLYATGAFTLCLVCVTELLSVVSLVRLETLAPFWIGIAGLAGSYLWLRGDALTFRWALDGSWQRFRGASTTLLGIGLILVAVLLVAVVSPPNNWDSMTCLMTRVARWRQEAGVGYFATTNHCHNYYAPLTEYAFLHFQILVDGDRFANTVQRFALVGSGIAASLIVREQRQPANIQVLAAAISVTLPMALLQASNTKDDLAVAFWIIAFAAGVVLYLREATVGRILYCGLALGFALLTKGNAYVVASLLAGALFAYALYGIVKTGPKAQWITRISKLACAGLAMALVALLVNSGLYARTWNTYGFAHHIVGSGLGQENLRIDEVSLAETWTNIIQNGAVHLALPSDRANAVTLAATQRIAGISDGEQARADPTRLSAITFRIQEDFTGNFLHFLLLCATAVGVAVFRRHLGINNLTVALLAAIVLALVVYSATVKWESSTARFQMPLFILGAPVTAVFVASLVAAASRSRPAERRTGLYAVLRFISARGQAAVIWTLLMSCLPYVFLNEDRPIFGTDDLPFLKMRHESIFTADRFGMYFNSRSAVRQSYLEAIDYLAAYEPREVGLSVGTNRHEYPIHTLFREKYAQIPRFDHVGVRPSNPSATLRKGEFKPPFVFDAKGNFGRFAGNFYRLGRQFDHVAIWRRIDDVEDGPRNDSELHRGFGKGVE